MIQTGGIFAPFLYTFFLLFHGRFGGDRLRQRGDPAPLLIVPIVYRSILPHWTDQWTVRKVAQSECQSGSGGFILVSVHTTPHRDRQLRHR